MEQFWLWSMWFPSLPDPSSLIYVVTGEVKRRACARPHRNAMALKAVVQLEWANMSDDYLLKSCRHSDPGWGICWLPRADPLRNKELYINLIISKNLFCVCVVVQ